MKKTIFNVRTGETTLVDMSAEEIAAMSVATIPRTITAFQAKAALLNASLLDQVEAFMGTAPAFAKLAWREAPQFERNSPTLVAMAAALGLTDAQLDDLFVYGAGVRA